MIGKRKKIMEEIIIPEGFNVEIDEDNVKISKNGKSIEKKIGYKIKKQENKLIIQNDNPSRLDKKLIKTFSAHIKNMIKGLQEEYIYKLQICSAHFPMNVSVHGNQVIIKNFLGEVKDRKAKIIDGVEVKVDKEIITVKSSDKEKAGQTSANIEHATKIVDKDRRIFQDGIYIIEKQKGGRK